MAWVFYLVLALVAVLWIGWRSGEEISWRLFVEPGQVVVDTLLGVGAALLLVAVWEIARRLLPDARQLEQEIARLLGGADRGELLGLALLSGFSEELFFRGAVQGAIGWVWATALFAILHTGQGRQFRLWTVFAALAGCLFAGLTLWRESLLAAIVAHVLVNAINLSRLAPTEQDAA